jgi:redox-sensitive bicupin YhaK (pirin superfamily)
LPEPVPAFVLRAAERGVDRLPSTGPVASYVAGHPESVITRHSSFNFGTYQTGRAGFGRLRVFGDEVFSGSGCGYNMHPHHNFVICAFVLAGRLTHVNTIGKVDELRAGDYYVFSAGSGGKHAELNIAGEDLNVLYLWFLPERLLLPPSYVRAHFDEAAGRNRIETLVGDGAGALPIPQDVRISRLVSDRPGAFGLRPGAHGVYAFVIDGALRCGGVQLGRRDSAGFWDVNEIRIETDEAPTDVLFVETSR